MIYFNILFTVIFLYSCDFQGREFHVTNNYYLNDYMVHSDLSGLNTEPTDLLNKNVETDCYDSIDNDNDNFYDCQDFDCCNQLSCQQHNSGCN